MVAIVTVDSPGDEPSLTAGEVSVGQVLQGNPNDNVYPPTPQELPHLVALALTRAHASVGKSYVIFTSFNRGGACPSALFGYEPATQLATFISQWSGPGPSDQIALPGRIITVPARIPLATLRARLYPTGGVTYPVETGESFCPGP
jgi:hypothetical protein